MALLTGTATALLKVITDEKTSFTAILGKFYTGGLDRMEANMAVTYLAEKDNLGKFVNLYQHWTQQYYDVKEAE